MGKLTPMMEQYMEVKKDYQNCLVFYRLGDFYEMFFDDAMIASRELDITLTGRDCGLEERAPMCGVPYHAAEGYIAKLIDKGYKVAICEQVEDPKLAKNIVKREVVRVITPGTVLDSGLQEGKNNYIVCLYEDKTGIGFACCDVTTGEFQATLFEKENQDKVLDELARLKPAEILIGGRFTIGGEIQKLMDVKPEPYGSWHFEFHNAHEKLCSHFRVLSLHGFGLEEKPAAICSAGALITYLSETQKNSLKHISNLKTYHFSQYMSLDVSSRKNLELTESLRDRSKKGTLLWVLDKTKTAMGARLLRKWVEQPLLSAEDINKRLDAVEEVKGDVLLREEIKEILNTFYDIERIMGKIIYGVCNGRDIISLRNSIAHLPHIKTLLSHCTSALYVEMTRNLDTLEDIAEWIFNALVDEPPFSIREGGMIKLGYNEDLDMYHKAKNQGSQWLMDLEAREKQSTGIKNLKVRFNKVFGYFIEVTNSYKNLVPDHYVRRQTLANCERYTTDELKKLEEAILTADDKLTALEYDLFQELREKLMKQTERIQLSAYIVAALDAIVSLGEAADLYHYVKPTVNNDSLIDIKGGRHPVVERSAKESFVPNDIYLDGGEKRVAIITGPNMAGKSTYMRQTALIVLMAQIGSFIPADAGTVGIVDKIFTRVGASDDIATGQSTFMVEMSEVANILTNATAKSLLILDEIGRGTSTFDGLSIAWAVLEYIADKNIIGAKSLFATHYHELTELEGNVPGVKNYCITVAEQGDDIVFLRKIARGGAQYSYGIHVAKLAGIPDDIIRRSYELMETLGKTDLANMLKKPNGAVQYTTNRKKGNDKNHIIIQDLQLMDIDSLSPREAIRALYDLQNKSKEIEE